MRSISDIIITASHDHTSDDAITLVKAPPNSNWRETYWTTIFKSPVTVTMEKPQINSFPADPSLFELQ